MLTSDDSADQLIDSLGLKQVTDTGAIEAVVEQVMATMPLKSKPIEPQSPTSKAKWLDSLWAKS